MSIAPGLGGLSSPCSAVEIHVMGQVTPKPCTPKVGAANHQHLAGTLSMQGGSMFQVFTPLTVCMFCNLFFFCFVLTYLPLCLNKISRTWCFSCLSTEASLRVGWQGTLCYWDMSAVEKGRRQRQRPFVDLYGASNHGWSVQGNEVHRR